MVCPRGRERVGDRKRTPAQLISTSTTIKRKLTSCMWRRKKCVQKTEAGRFYYIKNISLVSLPAQNQVPWNIHRSVRPEVDVACRQ